VMPTSRQPSARSGSFQVGDWLVEPDLNRVSGWDSVSSRSA
jgi:hypothetical protein